MHGASIGHLVTGGHSMRNVNPAETETALDRSGSTSHDDEQEELADRAADLATELYVVSERELRRHRFDLAVSRGSGSRS